MNQATDTLLNMFFTFIFNIHLVIIEWKLSCFKDKLSSLDVTMSPDIKISAKMSLESICFRSMGVLKNLWI